MVCWLDTDTRKTHFIVNDKDKLLKMYEHYRGQIWVGYNSRNYDQYILKAILCDFNPWEMNDWIINQDRHGYEFSKLLNNYSILNYDCSVGFRSLKELEAFMGHTIKESSVSWNIDRPLTQEEISDTLKYCKHDVMECFQVFLESKEEFESHIGLINEFNLDIRSISKTKAQISAIILGARKRQWHDEFDIIFPDTLDLGKYQHIQDWYADWAKNSQNYDEMELKTVVGGIPHTFGIGGLHGSRDKYFGDGIYLMADATSYYPAIMIEYNFLSRNVTNPTKFRTIRDERVRMKAVKDPRQAPRKIVLNGTFGASKDKYNNLYDPRQANNICIAGQLLLTDLIEKLEGAGELIQSNTDGILIKVYDEKGVERVEQICAEWSERTRMGVEFDRYTKVIQKDVNNYIIMDANGKYKSKGAYVKKLSKLDNNLPIVNKAVVDFFVKGVPTFTTINNSNSLMDFQFITKISGKYKHGMHNGNILHEKVHRCFASIDPKDGTLYKMHRDKTTYDKTASTPEHCFIDNDDVTEKTIPSKLDKQWYIDLANHRIKEFLS